MERAKKIVNELQEIGRNPKNSIIKTIKETKKSAVGCFPIYTPEELVYAAGALPVGMWGGSRKGTQADRYLQTFCCSVMKANTEQALSDQYQMLSAVIMTTYCDTLKCVMENWKVASPQLNIIPMVYPQNRKTEFGINFLEEELLRVKGRLEFILQKEISDSAIDDSLKLYDNYRQTMNQFVKLAPKYPDLFHASARHLIIKAGYFMDKAVYTKKISELLEILENKETVPSLNKRVILSGLMAEPEEFLDLFTENGMQVVADDLAHESRQFRVEGIKNGSWMYRMAERMSRQDGCAFLYDDKKSRGDILKDMVINYEADAIVIVGMKFCDPEEFDYPILKKQLEKANIPLLYLEIEQQMDSVEQLRTRIQSFGEMLSCQ